MAKQGKGKGPRVLSHTGAGSLEKLPGRCGPQAPTFRVARPRAARSKGRTLPPLHLPSQHLHLLSHGHRRYSAARRAACLAPRKRLAASRRRRARRGGGAGGRAQAGGDGVLHQRLGRAHHGHYGAGALLAAALNGGPRTRRIAATLSARFRHIFSTQTAQGGTLGPPRAPARHSRRGVSRRTTPPLGCLPACAHATPRLFPAQYSAAVASGDIYKASSEGLRAPRAETVSLADAMSFAGPGPERINGRLSMLAIVAALGAELNQHETVVRQLSEQPTLIALAAILVAAGSLVPLLEGAKVEQSKGFWNAAAEQANGRAASAHPPRVRLLACARMAPPRPPSAMRAAALTRALPCLQCWASLRCWSPRSWRATRCCKRDTHTPATAAGQPSSLIHFVTHLRFSTPRMRG